MKRRAWPVDVPKELWNHLESLAPAELAEFPAKTGAEKFICALALAAAGDRKRARQNLVALLPEFGATAALELAMLDLEDSAGIEKVLEASTVAATIPALKGRALLIKGLALHRLKRADDAIEALFEWLRVWARCAGTDDLADVHAVLGRCFGTIGRTDAAAHHFAMAVMSRALGGNRNGIAEGVVRLGRLSMQSGRLEEAGNSLELAITIARDSESHYWLACALNNLGEVKSLQGKFEEAEATQRSCLEVCGAEYPYVRFFAFYDLALDLAAQSKLLDAEAALSSARSLLGPDLKEHSRCLHAEGVILSEAARYEAAIEVLNSACAGTIDMNEPSLETAVRLALAGALAQSGHAERAEHCLLDGIARSQMSTAVHLRERLQNALARLTAPAGSTVGQIGGDESASWLADRFVRRELLGEGTFGSVYRAYDIVTGKEVAVKEVYLSRLYDLEAARFKAVSVRAELEAGSRIRHPGIARVYTVGQIDDRGDLYVVQELVAGKTLRRTFATDALPAIGMVAAQLGRILRALQALHESGVIHRDLKPENIVLNSSGLPVLIDFGIAHCDGLRGGLPRASAAGTYPYTAPEQLSGSAVDPRADLYSVGVIAYEWLSGGLPVVASVESDSAAWRRAVAKGPKHPLETLRPDTAGALAQLVRKLMHVRRWRRMGAAAEAACVFEAIAEEAVVGAALQ